MRLTLPFQPLHLAGLFFALCASSLVAQNTSNVFSPDVSDGEREAEWRWAYDPDTDSHATRLHVQYGLSEAWRMRLIAAGRASEGEELELRYMRWETQWQFREDQLHGWDSALRFEVQVADGDDRPSRLRLGWTNKWDWGERWQVRLIGLAGVQVGAERADGVLLEARYRLAYTLSERWELTLDGFSDFNRTTALGSWDTQEHQLGPLLRADVGGGWEINGGVLWGVSAAAADVEYRLHVLAAF
jgi:hypothetical protein